MSKVRRRELRISITSLGISIIALVILMKFFKVYSENGNRVPNLSALEATIIITGGLFAVPFGLGFFIYHLNRAIKFHKKLKNGWVDKWNFSKDDWKIFLLWETKKRGFDLLIILKNMLKRYGSFGLIFLVAILIINKFNFNNISPRTMGASLLFIFIGPVITLWNYVKLTYFFIEHIISQGEVTLLKEAIIFDGEYWDLNFSTFVTLGYVSEINMNVFEIKYLSRDSIDNRVIRIPIPKGKEKDAKDYIENILQLKKV